MNRPEVFELCNIDSEDISDVLTKIEKSFGFKFGENDLAGIKTFGELCDVISAKVNLELADDCTTQQAFSKIRQSIAAVQLVGLNEITLNSELEQLFPKKNRRNKIHQFEEKIGFTLKMLKPKEWIRIICLLLFLGSLVGLFVNWRFGLIGVFLSLIGSWIAERVGKEFAFKTVRDIAKKMARENYLKSRRNANTMNRREIVEKIKELFSHDLDLDPSVLTMDAFF
jgi:hypothetical protein